MLVGRVSNGNLGTGCRLQDLPDLQHRRPGQVDAPSKPHAQAAAMASLIDGQRDGMQNAATEARAIARFVFRQGVAKWRFCSADCLNLDCTQHMAGLNNNSSSSVGGASYLPFAGSIGTEGCSGRAPHDWKSRSKIICKKKKED